MIMKDRKYSKLTISEITYYVNMYNEYILENDLDNDLDGLTIKELIDFCNKYIEIL